MQFRQYGCWVTGEDGGQSYIMFWSESARDLFMGPGSKACVAKPYPAGKMPLDPPPVSDDPVNPELTTDQKIDAIVAYLKNTYGELITSDLVANVTTRASGLPDYDKEVNKVYNMVSEKQDPEAIADEIDYFIHSDLN